ncbi:hypothetical protein ACPOL_4116 [Acidisarcina polymorpha]|uniref:Uncharacterized protein n=1 Tax=Acidisarcina polymorpha TaxID=2211140 RepID=A0A2Z5G2G5_9BACT|nr:hypothetical protein ACPOL_4116 [Acidisarcina polymorpha]
MSKFSTVQGHVTFFSVKVDETAHREPIRLCFSYRYRLIGRQADAGRPPWLQLQFRIPVQLHRRSTIPIARLSRQSA